MQTYKRDWRTYNQQLINRGRFTIYVSEAVAKQYLDLKEMNKGKVGNPYKYSSLLIFSAFSIKSLFHLGYRQVNGMMIDIAKLMHFKVPDFRTINYRILKLLKKDIKLSIINNVKEGNMDCIIDSTGEKTTANNEYRTYRYDNRKDWLKMHFLVNKEGRIVNADVTGSDVHDGEEFRILLYPFRKEVNKVFGDGAYDTERNFGFCDRFGIKPIIRIRKNARHKGVNHRKKYVLEQFDLHPIPGNNQNWRGHLAGEEYRLKAQEKWKKENRYGTRWIVEGVIGNFKHLLGESVFSRRKDMKVNELLLKAIIYNNVMCLR